ncbi:MAG: conserved rane protein of unknown function [Deltaproteobacteria bacterium]|nr:conserved rane protein of unknown function [Deltaproteobacteria bacterium]
MKAIAANGYMLRHAKLEVRLVYTGFLFLALVGMVTMGAFELYHIGPSPSRVEAYYRGGESAGQMTFAKTFRELVEVTHFHSFIMGVVYLVLAHLFLATGVSASVKRSVIVAAFAGLASDMVSPWLIRYVAGELAYLQIAAWIAEWIGFGGMVGVPLVEMWFSNLREAFPPE